MIKKYDKNFKPDLDKLPDPQNTLNIEGSNTAIQKVGIRNFKIPFNFKTRGGNIINLQTSISAYVSLSEDIKGINMSRLSRILYEKIENDNKLATKTIQDILVDYKEKLKSKNSFIKFKFDYPYEQESLRSGLKAIKYYKVALEGKYVNNEFKFFIVLNFDYSSACPCSMELSEHARSERGIKAIPHSQRSQAKITIEFNHDKKCFWVEDLIDLVRDALKTETQVLVKREDEQAFAELNGIYPKFVEDASRLIYEKLIDNENIIDFSVVCNHYESLHSSDAVSVIYKGVEGGLR